MTWIVFALWMSGIYLMYYAVLIIWDLRRHKNKNALSGTAELTFEEFLPPRLEIPNPGMPVNAMFSSGGVGLQEIARLCEEEAIEYTKAVSF
ncbi:hypothetical protein GCM10023149_37740 [Mucilaginibacter gynuensis]|uniref:Uncharacterized protein n=1 Tax=Mucilaginibacter gynuensis TaxID=1302236 RepID=A0ABP8GYV9_9SPHI